MAHTMKLNIKKDEDTIRLPKSCIPVLADADSTDLRVLLCAALAAAGGESPDAERIAEELSVTVGEVNSLPTVSGGSTSSGLRPTFRSVVTVWIQRRVRCLCLSST